MHVLLLACYSIKLNLNDLDILAVKLKTPLHRKGNAIDLLHGAGFHKAADEPYATEVMQRIDGPGDLFGFGEKGAVATACLLGSERRIHDHSINPFEAH